MEVVSRCSGLLRRACEGAIFFDYDAAMTPHPVTLHDVPTPALVLDRARLARNLDRMSARARAAGIDLRPHMKTAKSARVAELATAGHSGGITVSTLAEAAYFLDRGVRDITYAVCMVPSRLDQAAALQQRGARLSLITDDAAVVRALDARAQALGARCRVLIEVDSGKRRTGVAWDGPALMDIARAIHAAPSLELGGVLTHAGHSYDCTSIDQVKQVAEDERRAVVTAADRLRSAGFACETVSAGATPTAVHAASFDGLTEIRPGVYMFFDLAQLGRGSCSADDLALSVLCTVISHQREHGHIIVDAGGLALSKDTSAGDVVPDAGYGWVVDVASQARIGDLRVSRADQEHGFVQGSAIPYDALPVGSRVRILPNHACITAAAHGSYVVVDGTQVVDRWDRVNGW